jgi:uncharacterized protein YbaP (TraB family)
MRVKARALVSVLAALALFATASARVAAVAAPSDAGAPPVAIEAPQCPPPAVTPTRDEVLAGMRAAVDSGLLWKATKDGRTVYLYGTIHVAQRSWMFPGPHVMHAVLASDTLALELDPTDPDIVARLQKAILRQPDSPTLPEAIERRLQAQMAVACVAPESLAPMRAEMQAVSIEVLQGRTFGLYPDFGIDVFLAGLGRGLKKPIRSLETPESQAALLVSDDPAETARSVGGLLDELEGGKGPQLLQRLAGDWQRGDLDDLDAYASWCGCLETPEQRADFVKLVDDRNPLMADKIVQWHAEGRQLFVAVGTLHMIGRGGLPALLKARGFQVERVPFGPAARP